MTVHTTSWLDQIVEANEAFRARIYLDKLPRARTRGSAVITCMDPRVNLEAIGIPTFSSVGEGTSSIRIIRTLGARADHRSLLVGIFLAGIREIVVLMHTDCGCCLAHSKMDVIIENMQTRLSSEAFHDFNSSIGEPFSERLREYVNTFEDPYEAVQQEIASIQKLHYFPNDVVLHGLVYELNSGRIEVVVNGYR